MSKVRNFGTGIMIKQVWVSMGKNGEYRELEKVVGGGLIRVFLVV